jgi:predicted SnoaL-like aldol condensation-catalyzing enzyme
VRARPTALRRSALLLFLAVLAAATGTALVGAGLVLLRPATVGATAPTGPVAAYVAAANRLLRTGDATALDAVLADDFVEHGPGAVFGPDRAGLARYLRVLRAAEPDLALSLDDALVSGPRVAVRLTAHGPGARTFLGTPVADGASTWTTWELFRIAGGKVAEHWASDPAVDLYQPLTARAGDLPIGDAAVVAVARLRPVGQVTGPVALPGAAAVAVEDGAVRVRADRAWRVDRDGDASAGTVPAGADATLDPGDVAFVPAGAATVRAAEARASLVVAVAVSAALVADTERWAQTPGGTTAPGNDLVAALLHPELTGPAIGGGWRVDRVVRVRPPATANDAVRIELGRVVLRPGTGFTLGDGAGVGGVADEAGALALAAMDGRTEIQRAPGGHGSAPMLRLGEPVALAPGDAVVVPPGDAAAVRNGGATPAVALVVVMAPTDPPAPPAPPLGGDKASRSPTSTGDDPRPGRPS